MAARRRPGIRGRSFPAAHPAETDQPVQPSCAPGRRRARLRGNAPQESGRNPQDQRMARLVGELSLANEDFRRWWGDHHVASRTRGNRVLRPQIAGDITLAEMPCPAPEAPSSRSSSGPPNPAPLPRRPAPPRLLDRNHPAGIRRRTATGCRTPRSCAAARGREPAVAGGERGGSHTGRVEPGPAAVT
ncbi:hypothetical protein ACFWBB_16565 [Streptomyces sp. NPDC060000]|uniref:MmyB family transcriptional regulator n=1 Tax=Streptomyces sp. NPDC060000 TaxID=3347031 RepID=UPI0036920E56